jgi:polyphosphate kinase
MFHWVLWEHLQRRVQSLCAVLDDFNNVQFLAIVSSNLDEFFMKRIGGLKPQVGAASRNAPWAGAPRSSRYRGELANHRTLWRTLSGTSCA